MTRVTYLFFLAMVFISCGREQEPSELEGTWEIAEMYSSGIKGTSKGWIEFHGDGTYSARMQQDETTREGEWKVVGEVIHLWQAEIRDLNGNRFMEPYQTTWNFDLLGEYLVMEGLPKYNVQHLKLILRKDDPS